MPRFPVHSARAHCVSEELDLFFRAHILTPAADEEVAAREGLLATREETTDVSALAGRLTDKAGAAAEVVTGAAAVVVGAAAAVVVAALDEEEPG